MLHAAPYMAMVGLGVLLASTPLATRPLVASAQSCDRVANDSSGKLPLPDLAGDYLGYPGGLYPEGRSNRPAEHLLAGVDIAENQVRPMDRSGRPDPDGQIVMISVGMSNTNMLFSGSGGRDQKPLSFMGRAGSDRARNPQLVIVNGAQGRAAVEDWVEPQAATWDVVDDRLAEAGVTPEQVQVAWVFQTTRGGKGEFPQRAQVRQEYFEAVARNLRLRFPNVKLAYYSTMHYSYTLRGKTPEPVTYEDGFAVRWMIERQITGDEKLAFDPAATRTVPWLSWGPYLWADGVVPRSDGLVWTFEDQGCGSHPQLSGVAKGGAMLYAFFKTDPTTAPWYLRSDVVGQPPENLVVSAQPNRGRAPLEVQFDARASDPDGHIAEATWTFGDGTFSYNGEEDDLFQLAHEPSPRKTFHIPGSYQAYVTLTDNDGNPVWGSVTVEVTGDPGRQPSPEPTDTPRAGRGDDIEAPGDETTIRLEANRLSTGAVDLVWTVDEPTGRGYKVERTAAGDAEWREIARLGGEAESFLDPAVGRDQGYSYRVLTADSSGVLYSSNQVTLGPMESGALAQGGTSEEADRDTPDPVSPHGDDWFVLMGGLLIAGLAGAIALSWLMRPRGG